MNRRNYNRYRRYGAALDPEVFRLPLTDSVLIEMLLKGSRGPSGGGTFNPGITTWSGLPRRPTRPPTVPWMDLVAKAALSWDQAVLDYLHDGDHRVDRSGSGFLGGVTLRMSRTRPPRGTEEEEGGRLALTTHGGKREPITDHLDIERLRARDPELLTELVRELSPRIWVAIRSYARDDDQADDLLQDCWVRILERLDTYASRGSFASWAIALSRNMCKTKVRARRRSGVAEVAIGSIGAKAWPNPASDEEPTLEKALRLEFWKRVVYDALGRLSDRERDVIVLRLLEGKDTTETASILEVSEEAVRGILVRGMIRLRQMEELRALLPEWVGLQ